MAPTGPDLKAQRRADRTARRGQAPASPAAASEPDPWDSLRDERGNFFEDVRRLDPRVFEALGQPFDMRAAKKSLALQLDTRRKNMAKDPEKLAAETLCAEDRYDGMIASWGGDTDECTVTIKRLKPTSHEAGRIPVSEAPSHGHLVDFIKTQIWDGSAQTYKWTLKNRGNTYATSGTFDLALDMRRKYAFAQQMSQPGGPFPSPASLPGYGLPGWAPAPPYGYPPPGYPPPGYAAPPAPPPQRPALRAPLPPEPDEEEDDDMARPPPRRGAPPPDPRTRDRYEDEPRGRYPAYPAPPPYPPPGYPPQGYAPPPGYQLVPIARPTMPGAVPQEPPVQSNSDLLSTMMLRLFEKSDRTAAEDARIRELDRMRLDEIAKEDRQRAYERDVEMRRLAEEQRQRDAAKEIARDAEIRRLQEAIARPPQPLAVLPPEAGVGHVPPLPAPPGHALAVSLPAGPIGFLDQAMARQKEMAEFQKVAKVYGYVPKDEVDAAERKLEEERRRAQAEMAELVALSQEKERALAKRPEDEEIVPGLTAGQIVQTPMWDGIRKEDGTVEMGFEKTFFLNLPKYAGKAWEMYEEHKKDQAKAEEQGQSQEQVRLLHERSEQLARTMREMEARMQRDQAESQRLMEERVAAVRRDAEEQAFRVAQQVRFAAPPPPPPHPGLRGFGFGPGFAPVPPPESPPFQASPPPFTPAAAGPMSFGQAPEAFAPAPSPPPSPPPAVSEVPSPFSFGALPITDEPLPAPSPEPAASPASPRRRSYAVPARVAGPVASAPSPAPSEGAELSEVLAASSVPAAEVMAEKEISSEPLLPLSTGHNDLRFGPAASPPAPAPLYAAVHGSSSGDAGR